MSLHQFITNILNIKPEQIQEIVSRCCGNFFGMRKETLV